MRKRKTQPWMTAAEYGRTLDGLSVNIIVRDVARSLPFYTQVLALTALYSDDDFAALEGQGVRLQLHADHTYERMPWASPLRDPGKRGLGAEIRILAALHTWQDFGAAVGALGGGVLAANGAAPALLVGAAVIAVTVPLWVVGMRTTERIVVTV